MADVARARKLAERIKVLVAEALERAVKDPDLGFVTITDVKVTPDLQHSTIFFTVYGTPAEKARSAEIIEKHRGVIRREVGRQLSIRLVPTIEFVADEIPETAAHMNDLLAAAKARDEEVAKLAADAHWAGEENPYKEPRQIEEDED
ncbi:30S ribosome-binding factor RbfA [Rhodoluna limnophila]|uniref:30S ribosome-binding factor RbfA n=1 Tax=Rhodoluna limnophila TaxID=232537 RepID=UPI001105A586|nr:30S ribosome-binding factor RbfA [Rhodoluna limnophila]